MAVSNNPPIIKRVRTLKNGGILGDVSDENPWPDFFRYNLIYGLNGSGKSTLAKLFARLQADDTNLPEGCDFSFEMSNEKEYKSTDLSSELRSRVRVFNNDFVKKNLHWESKYANSIFLIGAKQLEIANRLKLAESRRDASWAAVEEAKKKEADAESQYQAVLSSISTAISNYLNVEYRVEDIEKEYQSIPSYEIADTEELNALIELATAPGPRTGFQKILFGTDDLKSLIEDVRDILETKIHSDYLNVPQGRPELIKWIKDGYEYHSRGYSSCLFCDNRIDSARLKNLKGALGAEVEWFFSRIQRAELLAKAVFENLLNAAARFKNPSHIISIYRKRFNNITLLLDSALVIALRYTKMSIDVLSARQSMTHEPKYFRLPTEEEVETLVKALSECIEQWNKLVDDQFNAQANYSMMQREAREKIKEHVLLSHKGRYDSARQACKEAKEARSARLDERENVLKEIEDLRKELEHGPAADDINKLLYAYLGHEELKIVPVARGYQLYRHDRLVEGEPSEGEKTAIALCYFLTSLRAEGRSIEDLIVVIDDPISSLDTKAMNYASVLLRVWTKDAAQVFLLTHNMHCMNEFKKAWRRHASTKDENGSKKEPTAVYLFLDVSIPKKGGRRTSKLIPLPKNLEKYDSEYHFFYERMLKFQKSGKEHYKYWFMMPNVLRRVLEVFLGFKVPSPSSVITKLENLAPEFNLDKVQLKALDRLLQLESHSDNLEKVLIPSPLTFEEARDANASVLYLIEKVDERHGKAMRKLCSS